MSSLAGALVSPEPVSQPEPSQAASYLADLSDSHADPDIPSSLTDDPEATAASAHDEEMHDLFGEDHDADIVKHEDAATPASSDHAEHDGLSSPERKHREAMEYAEGDEPEPPIEQLLEANAAIPNIPVPRTSDGKYWVIRMPNFVKVDSKPFHPDTYVGPDQEDEDAQTAESLREKSMSIKLKVENTVRWRWVKDDDGRDRRQSNGRIIKWSDGSLSLQLGKELFDVTQTVDNSGAIPRSAIGGSQQASQVTPPSGSSKSQGLTYLVAQHKRAGILQCEALITGYMSLRPTGMQSETHRMLVRAVGQKHHKVARLRMAPDPTTDPEREKMELMKLASRKPRKARGEDDGLSAARKRRSYTRKRTGDDVWSDDEDEAVSGGASEDEYGDDVSGGRHGKRRKSDADESGRKGPGEYQTDDFVVADSDEEDADFDGGDRSRRKRRRRSSAGEEDEADDLEKLEAKIDQQEAEERKRRQREASGKSTESAAKDENDVEEDRVKSEDRMDIESEEEDDDFGARRSRAAPSARKRRAIGFDDDDEE
ncbi:Leo1-domain-containing protein [Obba rivulosa]|uniref:Leo1-domain-containing protein n=1 Tax=Obba rivulosa TaxID=1052685 RepID=A0A8E2DHV6_9APHY|nr:Leo1-domain-containing protein [Obba rivulosa]